MGWNEKRWVEKETGRETPTLVSNHRLYGLVDSVTISTAHRRALRPILDGLALFRSLRRSYRFRYPTKHFFHMGSYSTILSILCLCLCIPVLLPKQCTLIRKLFPFQLYPNLFHHRPANPFSSRIRRFARRFVGRNSVKERTRKRKREERFRIIDGEGKGRGQGEWNRTRVREGKVVDPRYRFITLNVANHNLVQTRNMYRKHTEQCHPATGALSGDFHAANGRPD